jgi:hypothetical protein
MPRDCFRLMLFVKEIVQDESMAMTNDDSILSKARSIYLSIVDCLLTWDMIDDCQLTSMYRMWTMSRGNASRRRPLLSMDSLLFVWDSLVPLMIEQMVTNILWQIEANNMYVVVVRIDSTIDAWLDKRLKRCCISICVQREREWERISIWTRQRTNIVRCSMRWLSVVDVCCLRMGWKSIERWTTSKVNETRTTKDPMRFTCVTSRSRLIADEIVRRCR